MNKVFVDTNVLLYLTDKSSIYNHESRLILKNLKITNYLGVVNSYVINEYHYQICRRYSKKEAMKITTELLKLPSLEYNDIEFTKKDIIEITKISAKFNLKTFDAYHAYYCKKEKIKQIATFDSDFKNIPWLKIYRI